MSNNIFWYLKHNPLTVYTLNKILDFRCRNVKAYIFIATTGRSGTATLSKIFTAVDNAVCLHEPSPVMFNDYPPGTDRVPYFKDKFYKLKRIYINTAAAGHSYYVEANHQFVKNFIDLAVECFDDRLRVIHLVRDPVSVGSSFYQVNSIPGETATAKLYMIDPRERTNLINISNLLYETDEFKHDLYKCIWYWYEVETRVKMAKQKHPNTVFYKLETDDLNNKDILLDMFNKLGIHVNLEKFYPLIGLKANTRLSEKTKKVDIEECRKMNKKLLKKMEQRYGKDFWVS